MKYAFLVALREYVENASTKGFWIGLLLFPIIVIASFPIMKWLEKATPTRHYVVIDRSGEYNASITEAMDARRNREVAFAFMDYMRKNSPKPEETPDMDKISADVMERSKESASAMLEQYIKAFTGNGVEGLNALAKTVVNEGSPPFEEPKRKFHRVQLPDGLDPNGDLDALVEGLKPYLNGSRQIRVPGEEGEKELFAALIIDKDGLSEAIIRPGDMEDPTATNRALQYWASNLADADLKGTFQSALNDEVRRREFLTLGMDADVVQKVQKTKVAMASLNPKKETGSEEVSLADKVRQWAPVGFVYLLWIAIITISQMLLNNTIEEKSNRIIEVLLSSVTAGELMMGKLIGIAAVGLTMVGVWVGALVGILGFKSSGEESEIAGQVFEVLKTSELLPAFVVYFILGYLLYSGIFLAIGSLCNTLKDAQNLMGPVMTFMMVPLFTMMFIPKDPNGTLATVMSWIPFYTPFVMMNRAAASPPMFDLVGTTALLVVTTALVLWLSGRIFRVGILRTGQRPKIVELIRWARSG